jgi:phosphoglycolate phosphatase-like HAD superfamily hydrolase
MAAAGTPRVSVLLVDLDGALGDTRSLWRDWTSESERVLGVSAAALPADRVEAAVALDAAGAGNWRELLERFAEERAPVYLRPAADASAALRRLEAAGATIGVFTDAPEELARVALSQLGAARRVAALEAGPDALPRLRARLGQDAPVARTREDLIRAAP